MTNQKHPITPPPELVPRWGNDSTMSGVPYNERFWTYEENIATQAAQWGADQELEACCQWLRSKDILEPAIDALRAARRAGGAVMSLQNVHIAFGALSPPIEEQLRDQGLKLDMDVMIRAHLQRDVDEVARLRVRRLLTEAESDKVRKRILQIIKKQVKPL